MPTALELTREERTRYIESARRRPAPPEMTAAGQITRERLLSRARQAAAMLKSRYGVRRVILFGSLAQAVWFRPDSDVDLAVEGLAAEAYWPAWRLLEEMIGERRVDVIEVETASESLRRAIERHGVEL